MDRRLFGKRISRLNKELDLLKEKRTQSREKRKTDDRLPLVCLVGYTNAVRRHCSMLREQAQPICGRSIVCYVRPCNSKSAIAFW